MISDEIQNINPVTLYIIIGVGLIIVMIVLIGCNLVISRYRFRSNMLPIQKRVDRNQLSTVHNPKSDNLNRIQYFQESHYDVIDEYINAEQNVQNISSHNVSNGAHLQSSPSIASYIDPSETIATSNEQHSNCDIYNYSEKV